MAITDDLRKTLSDPTPLYFAAGTADLAFQQARKVPGLVEQLRAEAPARIEALRATDPKEVRERAAARAKDAQARVQETQETIHTKVGELIAGVDTDIKKLGETAQDLAMRGVGIALEYAVKARETYEKVAEHGEQTVRTWRGEAAGEIEDVAAVVEPKAAPKAEPVTPAKAAEPKAAESKAAAPKAPAARRTAAAKKTLGTRRTTATKKTPPSAS